MLNRLLITGANGGVAKLIYPLLTEVASSICLTDINKIDHIGSNDDVVIGDLADPSFVNDVVEGCDGVLHLGGISQENSFKNLLPANFIGVHNLYQAAAKFSKPRIIFASSNHAVGGYRSDQLIGANARTNPDSYYGVSKVFGESVAQLYHLKEGVETAIVRIGSCFEKPGDPRMLSTWFSPKDFASLIQCCFDADTLGCRIIYGVSDNQTAFWENDQLDGLGWLPSDSADSFGGNLVGWQATSATDGLLEFHGGVWVRAPLIND